jgi:hypothetical protein
MRRFVLLLIFFCAAVGSIPVRADTSIPGLVAADSLRNACATQNPAFMYDDLSGVASPCAVAPGTLIVEMQYYQNASRVGGTALAAYPLFRLRTGIVKHLEALVDTPSQIAMSGLDGAGLYPTTHPGYGLNYTFASNALAAAAFGVEVLPPSSRFVVDQSQPKYVLSLTAGYRLDPRTTFSGTVTGSSSRNVGFARVTPGMALKLAFDAGPRTQISTDLGTRITQRHSVAQSYGDVAVNQRLRKSVTFAIGLGTTFNVVSNAKAHYLASGFNLQVK